PFRHARGRPEREFSYYRYGAFGGWIDRAWETLDWVAPNAPSEEAPINPRVAFAQGEPSFWRQLPSSTGWPFAAATGHWFVAAHEEPSLSLMPEVVPPWLARLDAHWAHALVLASGCGVGGECSLGSAFPADAFAELWTALSPAETSVPWWVCRERPVMIARQHGEHESFVVLHCDGSVPDGALERLSILARLPDVGRPHELPAEPDVSAPRGEWVPGVRLLHPRLLWVLHQLALAFPWRGIYIYSGYRVPEPTAREGHRSNHIEGRALDISVYGIPNEALLAVCRKLEDVGCGYYPNNKFVHVDVRGPGTGKALWIDVSGPGAPSEYVDSWPGVIEGGAMVWKH
ncbi:MAG TPA: D-Ala-D-Ala carboxypeptidase family metallohydrolase, partial [Polyangiaceae bacterium]|nr:D-Ala-D-Ala carboxypeptidase family metallohydrolase [Polyangiaceae bacterium]